MEELYINPINYLKKLNKKQIVDIIKEADYTYTNTDKQILTDELYDIIRDYLKKIDPKNPYFKRVGADEDNKIKLPFYLGSLEKYKNEKDINNWIKKFKNPLEYIIDEKLDGISCLLHYNNNKLKIYTRGNGIEGQNITHIKEHINGIIDLKDINIAIRGELIISKRNWDISLGSNARNVVAGAIHSKILNKKILEKIDFVAYDLLYPRMKLSDSLEYIKSFGFNIVKYIKINNITLDILSNYLQEYRNDSNYIIDGIVITHDIENKLQINKNPTYSFAFKSVLMHEQVEVVVNDIEWNISKDRYLKPIIKFNEILLNGVKIKQTSGFNANYIETNKLGIGSRIIIIRSGDVIPHIYKILSPSSNNLPLMPTISYKWNETHIDILLDNDIKNREQDIKSYLYFMKNLNIEGVKEGIITKLYDNGYDTLKKIINIKKDDLLKIDGFKEKNAENIINSLKEINKKKCIEILNASNILGRGFGEIKIKSIYDKYPFIFSNRKKALNLNTEDLILINGISNITSKLFIDNLPLFYNFYDDLNIKCIDIEIKKDIVDNFFKDKKFVFSGFRNKELEKKIIDNGGILTNTITKNTNYLIVKDINEETVKIKQAKEKKIQIISIDDL